MHLQDGGGEATPRKLTFKLAPWEGILTVKYLLICTNYNELYENLTSYENPGEGNLRFSSQNSQIPGGCLPPPPPPWGKPLIGALHGLTTRTVGAKIFTTDNF